jgi:hypothetical protein
LLVVEDAEKKCENCGRPFTPGRSDGTHCSRDCSNASACGQEHVKEALRSIGAEERGESSSLRLTGQPRYCHCNSSHFAYRDEDGGVSCHKCGGEINGRAISGRISREHSEGRRPADIAEALEAAHMPAVFRSRKWTADHVASVLAEGCYLPRTAPDRVNREVRSIVGRVRALAYRAPAVTPKSAAPRRRNGVGSLKCRSGMLVSKWEELS